MSDFFRMFRKKETGAVSVDWIVLTAAAITFCVVIFSAMKTNALDHTGRLATFMSTYR